MAKKELLWSVSSMEREMTNCEVWHSVEALDLRQVPTVLLLCIIQSLIETTCSPECCVAFQLCPEFSACTF